MKFLAIWIGLFCLPITGCHVESPSEAFERTEKAAQPFYEDYFSGSPDVSLAGIRKVESLTASADPKMWKFMDRNTYMALLDARICLAFERVGKTNEAAQYRETAIRQFQRRNEYNNEYHEMLPVTPSPSAEEAEKSLFFMVGKLDQHARQERNQKTQ